MESILLIKEKLRSIRLQKVTKNGDEVISRFVKAGEILGFLNEDDNNETAFSARAIDDTEICFIEYNTFINIVSENSDIALALLKFYANKVNELEEKYYKQAQMHVPSKVADALLTMYAAYGNTESGFLNLLLSRQEIAGLATTTKEQVSKILSEFKNAGIIRTRGKLIEIIDYNRLRNVALM
jgi:CRP/FNR family transcriptional regulator, polysaccharide utilization system transcription regulator